MRNLKHSLKWRELPDENNPVKRREEELCLPYFENEWMPIGFVLVSCFLYAKYNGKREFWIMEVYVKNTNKY